MALNKHTRAKLFQERIEDMKQAENSLDKIDENEIEENPKIKLKFSSDILIYTFIWIPRCK